MKQILLFISLNMFAFCTVCQVRVVGYMLSAYGDTARGYIGFNVMKETAGGMIFYDSTGQTVNNKSETWKGYGVTSIQGDHHFIKIKGQDLTTPGYFFAERILLGKISVYKYFYTALNIFQNNNNPFQPADNSYFTKTKEKISYYLQKGDGKFMRFTFDLTTNKKKILKELMDDCKEIKEKIKSGMHEKEAFELILAYNNTCG